MAPGKNKNEMEMYGQAWRQNWCNKLEREGNPLVRKVKDMIPKGEATWEYQKWDGKMQSSRKTELVQQARKSNKTQWEVP